MGALAAAVLATACGSSNASPEASSTPTASDRTVDPNFDFGQTVYITGDGFRPKQLIALVDHPVTWVNQTSATVTVVFDNYGGLTSDPIPPGGTWVLHPSTTVSIVFHSSVDPKHRGAVQVTPTTEPGS